MAITVNNTQSCIEDVAGYKVISICSNANETSSVMGNTPIAFNFNPEDVDKIVISDNGDMTIAFTSGHSATLVGYSEMINATGQSEIMYSDGTVTPVSAFAGGFDDTDTEDDSQSSAQGSFIAMLKPTSGTNQYTLEPNENYASDFTSQDVAEAVINEAGNIVITFTDGTQTTLTNYQSVQSVSAVPTMTLADGVMIDLNDILGLAASVPVAAIIAEDDVLAISAPAEAVIFDTPESLALIDPAAGLDAQSLAAIEPAAGDLVPTGAIQNTGADFGSSINAIGLGPAEAVGPIGVTSLSFDLPELDEDRVPLQVAAAQPPAEPVVRAPSLVVNNPIIKEDGSGDLFVEATLQSLNTTETLTVVISNLDSSWTIATGPNNGVYDSATETWTITMPVGQNYTGTLQLTPPADSDVDMSDIRIQAIATQTNGTTSQVEAFVDATVDAVIDQPILTASNITGTSGVPYNLDIMNAVTDLDGSETLGDVTISGVPNGFALNNGTLVAPGTWVVPQSGLSGLQINTPVGYQGGFALNVSVTATDNPTDTEVDTTDNTQTVSTIIDVNLDVQDVSPPTLTVNGEYPTFEDTSVFMAFGASLGVNAAPSEVLTVTLSGIPATWQVETGLNNGVYDSVNGTWTITMPAGQNYAGGLTFTPPADSDIDLTSLVLNATATQPTNGTTLSVEATPDIIVDAVADMPNLVAQDITGFDGQTIPLDIAASLTDTDGSESLTGVTLSGIPNEFNLTQGTKLPNGDWVVDVNDLTNLQLIVPRDYSGVTNVAVSVTSNEAVLDGEFDLTNNAATNTTTFNIDIGDRANPPTLDVAGVHQVLEDGSVFVPFRATTTGSGAEVLTVSVAGIPDGWDVTTGANNGVYDAVTRTWSITMPQGQNYDGGLTFAPPANSDVDLSNLRVTAKSEVAATNSQSSITELTNIIVDAVADLPDLNANAQSTIEAGQVFDLNITNALTDLDGSENLSDVTISGLPQDFTLSSGTKQPNGDWIVAQTDLSNLQVVTPRNAFGDYTIAVSVSSVEQVTDNEFDLSNNTATNTANVTFAVTQTDVPPLVTFGEASSAGVARVLEDGSVFVPISGSLQGNTIQVLTVTLTGVPSSWTVETGSNNGTYNPATGTWSITMPAEQNYDGGLTFKPPFNSDVDLSGLRVTARAENVVSGNVTENDTPGQIIVDAVADAPTLNVQDASAEAGDAMVGLNIQQALTDQDGSEILQQLEISGLPAGATLNKGNQTPSGVWVLNPDELAGLQINLPNQSEGTYQLTVKSTSEEQVTDEDFDLTNNVASTTAVLNLVVRPDSVPVIVAPSSPVSRESDLTTPNTITGKIDANFGADSAGAMFCIPNGGVFFAGGSYNGALSSNGVPISVTMANNNTQYVGRAGGLVVFTLTLAANGDYTYNQFAPLDHASPSNPNEIIDLNFGIKAQDGEGDLSPLATLTVRVQDTGPIARNDVVQMSSCDWVTMGNAITSYNQINGAAGFDSLSTEQAVIEEVSFGGQTYSFADSNAQSMSVDGQYGTLYIFKTGEYTYVSGQSSPKSYHAENFGYTLVDQDGDRSTGNINVTVKEESISSNPLSIYIYDLTNTVIDGRPAYQIQNTNGAFILADDRNDVLAGNVGDDAIFAWNGNDVLYGFGGNDILNGERDYNHLFGGSGADMFKIHSEKSTNDTFDTIFDFNLNEGDVIDIQDLLTGYDAWDNINDFVRIVHWANESMIQVNRDGQGGDFYHTALIKDNAHLDASSLTIDDMISNGYLDAF